MWLLIQKGSVSVDTAVPISMPFHVFPPPLRLAPFSLVVLSFPPPYIFPPSKETREYLKGKIAIYFSFPPDQLGKNAKQSADVHISQAFLGGGRRWAENGGARGVGVTKLAAHERDYFRS